MQDEFSLISLFEMAWSFDEVQGLKVVVEKVLYEPSMEAPPNQPHPFVYMISIINDSTEAVTILGRKWVLTNVEGVITVVEGDGVVGEKPRLSPGEQFSYSSYHVVSSASEVEGTFFGSLSDGRAIRVSIPRFNLKIPAP